MDSVYRINVFDLCFLCFMDLNVKNDQQDQIKSNQIKSNQIKLNQIKLNQIKSNQMLLFYFSAWPIGHAFNDLLYKPEAC